MKKAVPFALLIVVCIAFASAIFHQGRVAQTETAELDRLRLEKTFQAGGSTPEENRPRMA